MSNASKRVESCTQFNMHNEAWLADKFCELSSGSKSYLMLSINIKSFKYINLQFGWQGGNEIIYKIYLALQNTLNSDEYIAHISADAFVLLLPADTWSGSIQSAHNYIKKSTMPYVDAIFELDDARVHKQIYASLGIFPFHLYPCGYHEAFQEAELFRKTDESIKKRTFSVNFYTVEEKDRLTNKYALTLSTSAALQNNEYQVYIQPKVELATRKIVGGEALLRRFDSEGKSVPLSEFLPILNEEGYIRKVDWYVFDTACSAIGERISKNKAVVPISFNISKDFFYDVFLCDEYIATCKKHKVENNYIEFELMETISLDDTGRMIEVVSQFRRAGFRCSLDDFGNGYSSFGVLLNAQLDCVKLDRIFFINPLTPISEQIIKGVIDILKLLNFKIVAEGVETQEYVDCLARLGCDAVQGYYFYKPMPMADFMRLLDEQEAAL